MSAVTAGHEIADNASARPICTLQRAGVSGGPREPFVWHLGDIDERIPDDWPRADGVETDQQEARQLPQKQRLSW